METPPSPPRFQSPLPLSAGSKRRCLFPSPPRPPPILPPNAPSSPAAAAVQIPPSVETMLSRVVARHNCGLPDPQARRALASIGEAGAINILCKMFNSARVDQVSRLIMFLVGLARQSPHATLPPSPSASAASGSPRNLSKIVGSCSFSSSPGTGDSGSRSVLSAPLSPVPVRAGTSWPEATPQLIALGELEFRKAFLILSYLGSNRLEESVTVEEIRSYSVLQMVAFEMRVWERIGRRFLPQTERCNVRSWDLDKTHIYHCYVDRQGCITFKGPYLQSPKTHLQRVLGDDYVLGVKFEQVMEEREHTFEVYHRIAATGIFLGLRKYQFFVFKDAAKAESKKPDDNQVRFAGGCYFVCTESRCSIDENNAHILSNKPINEARGIFMHVHKATTLVEYMKRFSLILSKTVPAEIDLESVNVQIIKDVPCLNGDGSQVYRDGELQIQTDGTGFISRDLALKCPLNIFKGQCLDPDAERHLFSAGSVENTILSHMRSPPLLLQSRLFYKGFAVKGTLLVNEMLPSNTIQIRPSMIKIERDENDSNIQCINSLEIVTTSYQPKKNYLSKNLIALLHFGGVPKEFFLGLLAELSDVKSAQFSRRAAAQVASKCFGIGGFTVLSMIFSGIPLDETYLQYKLRIFVKEDRKAARLPISESYYLMGTTDPTNTLEENEVCVILESGQVSGDVLVYRNPGLHFGDLHRLKATYVPEMEKFVGHSKYGIFFSSKGQRSVADEMAGGDYDGDMYWISRNRVLLEHFKTSDPWVQKSTYEQTYRNQQKPSEFSNADLEKRLFQSYLDCAMKPSYNMSTAADSWLSFMDRLLTLGEDCHEEKECLRMKIEKLINIYYVALDAPKTGTEVNIPFDLVAEKFPHFMEKQGKPSYHSNSILGLIYDRANSSNDHNDGVQKLPCFCEQMPSSTSMTKWQYLFDEFNCRLAQALSLDKKSKEAAATTVKEEYKMKLHSSGCKEQILDEALAIYHVVYDYASNQGNKSSKCYFPWEIACGELCDIYAERQGLQRLNVPCVPNILAEVI